MKVLPKFVVGCVILGAKSSETSGLSAPNGLIRGAVAVPNGPPSTTTIAVNRSSRSSSSRSLTSGQGHQTLLLRSTYSSRDCRAKKQKPGSRARLISSGLGCSLLHPPLTPSATAASAATMTSYRSCQRGFDGQTRLSYHLQSSRPNNDPAAVNSNSGRGHFHNIARGRAAHNASQVAVATTGWTSGYNSIQRRRKDGNDATISAASSPSLTARPHAVTDYGLSSFSPLATGRLRNLLRLVSPSQKDTKNNTNNPDKLPEAMEAAVVATPTGSGSRGIYSPSRVVIRPSTDPIQRFSGKDSRISTASIDPADGLTVVPSLLGRLATELRSRAAGIRGGAGEREGGERKHRGGRLREEGGGVLYVDQGIEVLFSAISRVETKLSTGSAEVNQLRVKSSSAVFLVLHCIV